MCSGGCGQYARVLLVPEEAVGDAAGRCQRCVIALMSLVFREEAVSRETA
jgi:hypothetical protein